MDGHKFQSGVAMCDANNLDMQRPRCWSVVIDGVGEEYECP